MYSRVDFPSKTHPRKYRNPAPRKLFAWCSVWSVVGLLITFVLFADESGPLETQENAWLGSSEICRDSAWYNAFQGAGIVVLCKGDNEYKEASRIWNLRSQRDPLGVVQPQSEEQVSAILATSVQHGVAVTVKGGGHSPAGWALQEDAILIDLSKMNGVKVDPSKKELWAEGGAIWEEVVPLMERHGLAYVGGECPSVGVAGVALGGGTGWLSRDQGLISDSIISLNLALPNGTMVEVSATSHPDLLWALSGAGHSNFGIVTAIRFRLYDAQPEYFAGDTCWGARNADEFRKFARAYAESIGRITDNRLTIYFVLRRNVKVPYGVCYTLFFNGPKNEGPEAAKPFLDELAKALDEFSACLPEIARKVCPKLSANATSDQVANVKALFLSGEPFQLGLTFADFARVYGGSRMYLNWKSGVLAEMSIEVMDAMVDAIIDPKVTSMSHGDSIQIQINHNGGAISEKPANHSAFPFRSAGFVVGMHGMLSPPPKSNTVDKARNSTMHEWSNRNHQNLSRFFVGAYSNYNDREQGDWKTMYYGGNVQKLEAIKRGIDGHEIFRSFQRL